MDTSERIVIKREPRRRRSVAEKRRIVEETLAPDASVAKVARAHGVNANQVFAWRRQYHQGLLGETQETANLLPVHVTGTRLSKARRAGRRASRTGNGGSSGRDLRGTSEGTTSHCGAHVRRKFYDLHAAHKSQ